MCGSRLRPANAFTTPLCAHSLSIIFIHGRWFVCALWRVLRMCVPRSNEVIAAHVSSRPLSWEGISFDSCANVLIISFRSPSFSSRWKGQVNNSFIKTSTWEPWAVIIYDFRDNPLVWRQCPLILLSARLLETLFGHAIYSIVVVDWIFIIQYLTQFNIITF